MEHINLPSSRTPRPLHPASPTPRPRPEAPAAAAPHPREAAGAEAPASLASSSAPGGSTPSASEAAPSAPAAPAAGPRFEKRSLPAPEIPGVTDWIGTANPDKRSPQAMLTELREARAYFAGLLGKREQTDSSIDGERTQKLINPILHAENARSPGLNAVECTGEEKMGEVLKQWSNAGGPGQEGHIRFHLGVVFDMHRIAVDAYRHPEGGFTLVAVDSMNFAAAVNKLGALEKKHPGLIKGTMVLPTPNLAHGEGCRIFGIHTLNAMHDFQPYVQGLHRQIFAKAQGKPAPVLSGPKWKRAGGNTHILVNRNDSLGLLPAKFFKHMQVMKPKAGESRTLLDEAEDRNPALKDQPVNKKGQTLRERFASQNPSVPHGEFSRADRTASLDKKRLVLIDRAIAHYEELIKAGKTGP
jgi:hypothetical protein